MLLAQHLVDVVLNINLKSKKKYIVPSTHDLRRRNVDEGEAVLLALCQLKLLRKLIIPVH